MSDEDLAHTIVPPCLIPPSVCYTCVFLLQHQLAVFIYHSKTSVSGSISFVEKELLGQGSADRSWGGAKIRSLDVAQSPEVLKGAQS